MSLQITLTPEEESLIHAAVSAGRYDNAEEAVHAAMELLRQRESKQRLYDALKRGIESGPAEPADWPSIREEARAFIREKSPNQRAQQS